MNLTGCNTYFAKEATVAKRDEEEAFPGHSQLAAKGVRSLLLPNLNYTREVCYLKKRCGYSS